MTTYLIAQTTHQLNLKHTFQGKLIVWVGDYKLAIGYDLEELKIWIEEVYKGIYLSNDLKPSFLPRWVNLNTFQRLMKHILALRYEEIKEEAKRIEEEEREGERQLRLDEETENRINTESYLNDTFGLY